VKPSKEYQVIIIGGGITGAATARDCALRGLSTLLIEKEDLCDGASGRNHGLLHSGARYAVTDREGAEECIRENCILRKIAAGCVEPSEGLFISLPEDGLDYQANFILKCREAGIDAEAIDPAEALRMEPAVNPSIIGAVKVPDAAVDPFRLVDAHVLDAMRHGADVRKFTEVAGLVKDGDRVCGVKTSAGEIIRGRLVVLAAGIWTAALAEKAGVHIEMMPSKGSLIIFGHRVANMVINRCRKPANADILVPGDVVSVLGTTSDKVPMDTCDNISATPAEVDLLLKEGVQLVPALAKTRIIRAYAGVRPLVVADSSGDGRNVSRGIVLLDHEVRDGVAGLITITGGKLTTARLMAEMATDLVCRKLGSNARCETAERLLPGSEGRKPRFKDPFFMRAAIGRHGTEVSRMDFGKGGEILCECESVTRAEIGYAVREFGVRNISDLRRHTRIGMGTCQGSFCIQKVANALAEELDDPACPAEKLVSDYLQERWKGMIPVLWGDTLREAEYMHHANSSGNDDSLPEFKLPVIAPVNAGHGAFEYDAVIIGGGRAGCSAADALSDAGLRVCVVSEGISLSASGSDSPYARLSALQKKEVTVLRGDRVLSGVVSGNSVESVTTRNLGPSTPLRARIFILAGGKFFARGLMSDKEHVWEPVFNADVFADSDRTRWYDPDFAARQPYMDYGVSTDAEGRVSVGGHFVDNLYAVGDIIGHEQRDF
jgi:glycerol-3-phosphate dehydrogenase